MNLTRTAQPAATLALAVFAALSLASLPVTAWAEPQSLFVPFEGAGNVSDFGAGSGGWVGSIDQVAPPLVPQPLSLVSVVLFQLDALTQTLSGSFTFTSSADLNSTLYGEVSGTLSAADILASGGLFTLDYTVLGGTGAFTDASGYGLAFLNYDPSGNFNNYAETGLLNLSVPEPASLALTLAGLALLGASLRKARPVN